MNRLAIFLLISSLVFAACAHDHALDRHDRVGMQNRGELAGLLVSPSEEDGLFVPAKSLLEILSRLRAAAAPDDPSAPAARPHWFTEGLAAWGSPRPPPQEGSYDEQYTTW